MKKSLQDILNIKHFVDVFFFNRVKADRTSNNNTIVLTSFAHFLQYGN